MGLYLIMIINRFNVTYMQRANWHLEELVHDNTFLTCSDATGCAQTHINDVPTIEAYWEWLDTIESTFIISQEIILKDDGEFAKEGRPTEIFYLHDYKNYLLFQGITYCMQLNIEYYKDNRRVLELYTGEITLENDQPTIKYNADKMHGLGGHCMNVRIENDETTGERIHTTWKIKEAIANVEAVQEIKLDIKIMEATMIVAESAANMVSVIDLDIFHEEDGFVHIEVKTESDTIEI